MTGPMIKRLGAVFPLLFALLALAWRWHVAGGLEPRVDQAGFFQWVESALDSDHLLPRGSLAADDASALHNLLRPLVPFPHLLLTLSDWLISLPFLLLGGMRYSALVMASVAASALSVGLVVSAILKQGAFAEPKVRLIAGSLAGASLLLNFYSVHYAGFILHNFSVCLLTLCAVTLEDCARSGGRRLLWGALLVVLALYAHWTVLLLLPPALGARLLFSGSSSWRQRFVGLMKLGLFLAVALLPLASVMLVLKGSNPVEYMELGRYGDQPVLGPMLHRFCSWFAEAGELFSYPGLAAGIGGLILLARRGRCTLPAWMLLAHFLLTALMPGFTWNGSNTYLRTYLYTVPLLSLGIGALALELSLLRPVAGWRAALSSLAALLLLAHFAPSWGQAMGAAGLSGRSPHYYADYIEGQGALAETARRIVPLLPEGAAVVPFGWAVRDLVFAMAVRPTRHYHFPFALEPALDRVKNGTLTDFVHRRGLPSSLLTQPFYVIDVQPRTAEALSYDLKQIGGGFERPPSSFAIELLAQWQVGVPEAEAVSLYRVVGEE